MILDTFKILFTGDTSNLDQAAKRAAESAKKLEDATKAAEQARMAAAAASTKQVDKQAQAMREAEKVRREAATQAKKDERELADLQKNKFEAQQKYSRLIEGVASTGLAVLGYTGIRSGISNAYSQNVSLETISKATKLNLNQLKAWQATFATAGTSSDEFNSMVLGMFERARATGQQLAPLDQIFKNYRKNVSGLTDAQASQYLATWGITGLGAQNLLRDPNFEGIHATAAAGVSDSAKGDPYLEAQKEIARTATSVNNMFTTLANDVLPPLIETLRGINDWLNSVKDNKGVTYGVLGALGAGTLGFGVKGLKALFGAGGGGIARTGMGLLGRISILGAAYGIGEAAWWGLGKEQEFIQKTFGKSNTAGNEKESYNFWKSQGYTDAQIAGLMSNERWESGFDPNAANGSHTGAAQWSQDRRMNILRGTGIDVSSASHADQLRAWAWEMKQRGNDVGLRSTSSAYDAAAYLSNKFEVPSITAQGLAMEANKRGRYASDLVNSLPSLASPAGGAGGGNTNSVNIEALNVHTQATDAQGMALHASDAIKREINTLINNNDGGAWR